jgi:Tfp pilus assembly protein FimT
LRHSSRGYSLMELVVVLGIIIVLAAMIVPTVGPMRRQGRMRVGAATVAESLRLARSLAVSQSVYYCVDFDPVATPQQIIVFQGVTGSKASPERVDRLPEGVRFQGATPADGLVLFNPDGSCSGNFTVKIRNADSAPGIPMDERTIAVTAASGRVSVSGGSR